MAKTIIYDNEARSKILDGVSKISKAVGSTFGPKGNNVAFEEFGTVHLTKDGITVARNVDLSDRYENLGAHLVREASEKTAKNAGDGTTGSVILTEAIFKNGLNAVNMGANSIQVKNGIIKAAERVVNYIKSSSKTISTKEEIKQVAKISANGDEEIAEVIAEVFDKLGTEGTIKVEDGNGTKMESKIVEGMVLERGYLSPYFISNDRGECNLDHPLILITDKKLGNFQELLPVLQAVSNPQAPRQLLIIAENLEGDALATIVMNKMRGAISACAIQAPSYGDNRKSILKDLAVLTGGQVVSDDTGVTLQMAASQPGVLGSAKSIVVTKDTTTIIGGDGDKETFDKYVTSLKTMLENTDDEFESKKLRERISKLTTGIGIIQVGATTEAELKEKKDRVDDAFNSAKNSIKSGIVAGGGVALLNASTSVDISDLTGDEKIGADILVNSLCAPIDRILDNAGESSQFIIESIKHSGKSNYGYEVLTKKYTDMIEAGVIDPTAVIINEVQNASSIAGLLLTTSAVIVDEVTTSPNQPAQ